MTNGTTSESRRQLVGRLYRDGIPALWCPPLTHFAEKGRFDTVRIRRHLQRIAPHARGILVPGSTGEGWEMRDGEIRDLLSTVMDAAHNLDLRILIGVLKFEAEQVVSTIGETVAWLRGRTGESDPLQALIRSNVVGFTVCPPKGRNLSQDQIIEALAQVLRLGHPTALYQLPQVTENEMAPESVAQLAASYPNFYLLKDTSSKDRVAMAGLDLGGVFLVRGAEGQYWRWPKSAGGPYDGFLLSTANCFACELAEVQLLLKQCRGDEARALSDRIEAVIEGCFEIVRDLRVGNPFANANKIIDHILAYGKDALDHDPPLLYSGVRLPASFLPTALDLLREQKLLPARGYVG